MARKPLEHLPPDEKTLAVVMVALAVVLTILNVALLIVLLAVQ